jgi:hypothetical protein
MTPNFYYDQEDWLKARQAGKNWVWTVLRPQIISGIAVGSNMNVLACIGVYAAICKELDLPLRFPGGAPRLQEATDNRLLARAMEWAGQNPACANEAFNITNGDCYIWQNLWSRFADFFDMAEDVPFPCSLQRVMVDKEPVWQRIAAKHDLAPYEFADLVPSWQFADFVFGYGQRPNPALVSTIKARQYGFHDCIDTETMFLEHLERLRHLRIIPPV